MQSLLAKWFHIQPSEMEAMTVDEFLAWVDEANAQIDRQNKAYERG